MSSSHTQLLISKGDIEGLSTWIHRTPTWKSSVFAPVNDSCLHLSVRHKQIQVVRLFLANGHPAVLKNDLDETPLMLACDLGVFDICQELASRQGNVSAVDMNGATALHRAAATGSEACIRLLVAVSGRPDPRDSFGDTPLHSAAVNAQVGAVRTLLTLHADIEAQNQDLERPIHKAAAASDPQAIEVLLEKGAEFTPETAARRTPLGIAIRAGNLPCVEALVRAGVQVTKEHIKTAKEASRAAVWRYLQSVAKRPHQLSLSSGEGSPIRVHKPQSSEEDTSVQVLTEQRDSLLDQVASLQRSLTAALMPTVAIQSEVHIGELIGRGSYGEVFKGKWRGTEVAVKKLICPELESEFKHEAMVLHSLRHPNIVLLMGICLSPPALIEEYIPQGSLHALIHKRDFDLSQPLLKSMALDIARAMNYLHTNDPQVLHRDLTPANCLVSSDFRVKIIDFGLARVKSASLQGTKSLGTVQYSAPEFMSQQVFTSKSDVYSFGVLLWEMVTRETPYSGLQPVQVVYAVVNNARRPGLDADTPFRSLIVQCWSQDPSQRPDFSAVISELETDSRF